jgi:hypothetical protein
VRRHTPVLQVDLAKAVWRKSTRSSGNGAYVVAVRDSKDRGGPVHVFTPREWAAFVGGVLDGEFERP